jgi:esterase/lipase
MTKISKRLLKYLIKLFKGLSVLSFILVLLLSLLFVTPALELEVLPLNDKLLDFDSAKNMFGSVVSDEVEAVNPVCKSKLLDHGKKTSKVIVIFHGFTNCPAQFDQLAKQMFEQGYNVFIPRLPHHGLADRLTENLAKLTTFELQQSIKSSLEIAMSFGQEVTLFGISGGSVMAAWAGYNYPEIKKVFLAAPLFAPKDLEELSLLGIYNFLRFTPNQFVWWDSKNKQDVLGPKYAYPRYSTRASTSFLNMSLDLNRRLKKFEKTQAGKKMILLTLQDDTSVSNTLADKMAKTWSSHGGTWQLKYRFSKDFGLVHDFVDPNQTQARVDISYPVILSLLNQLNQ